MSFQAMADVIRLRIGNSTAKFVLMMLAHHARDGVQCWPSVATLAENIGSCTNTVRKALVWLEEHGHIRRERRSGKTDIVSIQWPHPFRICTPSGSEPLQDLSLTPSGSEAEPIREPITSISSANAPEIEGQPSRKPKAKLEPKKGCRLPAEFELTASDYDVAKQEGLSDEHIQRELAQFRDHWLASSGANAVKRDWHAAWRNWARKAAAGFGRTQSVQAHGHGPQAPSLLRAYQRAASRYHDPDVLPERRNPLFDGFGSEMEMPAGQPRRLRNGH